jgi:capsular exopolysaccharide synthesis family protein
MNQQESQSSLIEEIHLRDYLRVMYKRRWTIIACFFLIVVSVAIYTFTSTPIYRGTATVIIEKDNPNVLSIQEIMAVDSSGTDYYQTQYKIIESRSLARKVISKLNLAESEEFNPKPKDDFISTTKQSIRDTITSWKKFVNDLLVTDDKLATEEIDSDLALVDAFTARVTVEPIRNSRLVKVSFDAKNPHMAAKIANAIAQSYIEQNLENKLDAVQNAVSWLDERIQEERAKVEQAELKLQRYKEENSIITGFSSDNENITAQKLAELNSQVIEAEAKRVEAQTRYEQTNRLLKQGGMVDSIPEILNSELIRSIKQSEVELSKRLSELSKKYGSRHPQIIAVKAELQTLEKRRTIEIRKVINSLKSEYEVALAREQSLKVSLGKLKKEALELNKKSIEFGVLQREAENSREMYELLIKRFKEASLTEDIKAGNIRIIDRAEIPDTAVKPKKKLNLLLGLIVGLTLGVGLAFFLEYLDNTIKTPDDVKKLLKIPYLAPVPEFEFDQTGSAYPEIIAYNMPKSTASEAYRGLRTSLLFSSAGNPPQVLMITSAGPGEGKTLTSVNLATTMAQFGSKVILIDCDLRRPRLHRVMKIDRENGTSNILAGSQDHASLIQHTEIKNLDVIPSGPVPPNPSELLGSLRMQKLIETLRKHYDRIIIDSPPVTAVTDSTMLSNVVDGVVLVVRAGETAKDVVVNGLDSLRSVKAKILGAVLNGVNIGKDSYYYYQYYYYYYGDDGAKKKKNKRKKRSTKVYGEYS